MADGARKYGDEIERLARATGIDETTVAMVFGAGYVLGTDHTGWAAEEVACDQCREVNDHRSAHG